MGEFSIWHWLIVLLVVALLFGGGKVSGLMGDVAKGIKEFKKNMADEPKPAEGAAPAAAATLAPPAPARTEARDGVTNRA
ncbi:MAG: twin-arginine translocase TatA/TatE family subunit [Acetobacteraceae bacterium]